MEDRIEWIKKLRKGRGLVQERSDVPLELFGATDWESLVDVISIAFKLTPMTPPVIVLGRALNLMREDNQLTQRRKELKEAMGFDVPLRTAIRWEESAAIELDKQIEVLTDPLAFHSLVSKARSLLQAALTRPDGPGYSREKVEKAVRLIEPEWPRI